MSADRAHSMVEQRGEDRTTANSPPYTHGVQGGGLRYLYSHGHCYSHAHVNSDIYTDCNAHIDRDSDTDSNRNPNTDANAYSG